MVREQTYQHQVSFGDCDPAGIVFYPNIFRWMDASFHHFLSKYGGHAKVCKNLNALGLGLIKASSEFKSPLKDGDQLDIHMSFEDWTNKTYGVKYIGRVGDRVAFEGREVRALFELGEKGIRAANVEALQKLLAHD